MVGCFFNDRLLMGNILLNQFDYATACVESINIRIHGLCMGASGNNVGFILLLRDYVKLKEDVVWVDKNSVRRESV